MKKRNIKSFEPEDDVLEMLNRSKEAGIDITSILNMALRQHGPTVIKELAKKKKSALLRLSFNAALSQPSELSMAA